MPNRVFGKTSVHQRTKANAQRSAVAYGPGWLTRAQMEDRRKKAVADLRIGIGVTKIARKYGVSRTTVYRWQVRKNLNMRKATGRPRRMDHELIRDLIDDYNIESSSVLQAAILDTYGVVYHRDHVCRLLKKLRAK